MEPLVRERVAYDAETGLAVPEIAVWMVFLTIFLDMLAATISTPALPYYAKEFGATNADIGYLFAAWSFTSTFCAPMLGRLSDRIGRKHILLLSLLGAGAANVGQATAPSYWVLFAWRAFSGVWAAVGSSAQVYLTDVCSPDVLPDYMSKLSSVPGAAMTFGPGLGGGLSTFGLNMPILVDGLLSFAAAGLVAVYLPESPLWHRGGTQGGTAALVANVTPTPRAVYVLGISGFLWGIAFGTRVSMQVVALNAKLGFNALQVGYVYVVFAVVMLCQNMWITPRLQRLFGLFPVAITGSLVQAVFTVAGFAGTNDMWCCLLCLALANSGNAARMAASGPICALFTDPTNRGTIFSQVQMMTNFGRLIGPVVAGNLSVLDPVALPWVFAASCNVLSAVLLMPMKSSQPTPPVLEQHTRGVLPHGFSSLEHACCTLEDEVGNQEDYEKVGRYVGDLLTRRHYQWVSKQDGVLALIDRLLPELRVRGHEHLEDLQTLMKHADSVQTEFHKLGERQL